MTALAAPPDTLLAARVQTLEAFFRQVQHERMQGVPILNAALQVQAVGFVPAEDAPVAEGVLITPWFMSLLRLPLQPGPVGARVGSSTERAFGNECFEFLTAYAPALGGYESCALFSPMNAFSSQAQAVETAQAVCAQLRARPAATAPDAPAQPGRRTFFLPRAATAQPAPAR